MEGLESTWFVHPESISVNITVAGNALQALRTEWTPQAGDPLLSCPLDPKQASKQNQNELHVKRLNVIGAPVLALFLAYLEPGPCDSNKHAGNPGLNHRCYCLRHTW